MPQIIREAVSLTNATPSSGRIRIKVIDAGVGSSGTYPAKTLEAAAKDKVFAKGTHMYMDHPTQMEDLDRPERTVKDLAGVLESDAVYENGALYAEAKVFPAWRSILDPEVFDHIGVSIRASAEVDESGGSRTITKLVHAESVDFVTKAGRGGQVMEVLESARAHAVAEATANDTREWLQAAVKGAAGEGYSYVRDFDESNVWYETWTNDSSKLYQQGYTLDGNTATLTGDPTEVRVETSYVPITPAKESKDSAPNPAAVTENQEEANMATIDDKELADLRESASRATAAEADITTARERATRAETALTLANDTAAAAVVEAAFTAAGISAPKTAARLSKGYPVDESGVLNSEALAADVAESIAELQVANGAGSVRGVGHTASVTESADVADADVLTALKGA
jgi:hypothetical protein